MANHGVGAGCEPALIAHRSFFRRFIRMLRQRKTDISLKAAPYEQESTGAIAGAGYFLREVNCCLRVMPFPSSMVTIWPAATPVKFSLLPSSQCTDISAAAALPSPKCTRKLLCEMKEPPLRTSLICL